MKVKKITYNVYQIELDNLDYNALLEIAKVTHKKTVDVILWLCRTGFTIWGLTSK